MADTPHIKATVHVSQQEVTMLMRTYNYANHVRDMSLIKTLTGTLVVDFANALVYHINLTAGTYTVHGSDMGPAPISLFTQGFLTFALKKAGYDVYELGDIEVNDG